MKTHKFFQLFTLAVCAVTLAFVTGCEGPEGPQGPAGSAGATGPAGPAGEKGDDGTPGVAGNVTCLECHSADTPQSKLEEFHRSAHASGAIAVDYAGGRSSCAACHSHEGFLEFARTGTVAADITNPSAWECKTCHNIHTTFEAADYAFRLGDPVDLLMTDGTRQTTDALNNNTCINCHQSRRNIAYYDGLTEATFDTLAFTDPDDVAFYGDPANVAFGTNGGVLSLIEDLVDEDGELYDSLTVRFDIPLTNAFISSTHAGPHHGPQGNLWAGLVGSVDGTPFAAHDGGCVMCHMGPESGHSFIPEEENCTVTDCHGTFPDDDLEAIEDRIMAVGAELEALHAIHLDDPNAGYVYGNVHPIYASLPRAEFQAWWDFTFLLEDRSNGAHNPDYADTLLDAAEAALGI